MLASMLPALSFTTRLRPTLTSGRLAPLSMSAYYGPRQQEIEQKLLSAFSPTHMSIENESHGRKEDA